MVDFRKLLEKPKFVNLGKRGRSVKLKQLQNPHCQACDLRFSSKHVCVMGRGNVMAHIMLVGEAPGEAEAKTGKPFMGRAGKYLTGWLHELDMLGEVYISNICRCRPPSNRKPTPNERKICGRLYLIPEVRIINPRVIVAMGRTPIDYLLPNAFERGEAYYGFIGGAMRLILPTWHPAYFLHSGSKQVKLEIIRDLSTAKELAKEQGT